MMWKEIIERKRWIIMVPIVMVILLLISLEVYVDIKSQKIDEEYGVHYMPYRDDIDSIGSDICFDVTAIGAEYGEIDFTYGNMIYSFLGEINKYVDILQKMQTIAGEMEYNENLEKTDEVIVPTEANGISTNLTEWKQMLQMNGIQWNFIENAGMYMWRSRYRYYFAKEESRDIIFLLRCDQFIIETRIYQKSSKVMGYEMRWFQIVKENKYGTRHS